jgi:hypothetical protein
LRKSAPDVQIILIVPFGQYYARELRNAIEIHMANHPADAKVGVIDLGPAVAKTLATKNGLMGGLHLNDRGHAVFASQIIPQVMGILNSASK